jgi:D-sedoheptulose 7-phosphate isomerase
MTIVSERFFEFVELLPRFEKIASAQIEDVAKIIVKAFSNNHKILICGNGGSAADAQHFAAEFVNVFSREIQRPGLPAIALTTDTSVLTSIANDFSFENIFSRQVEALGSEGDVLIVFTTSGDSANILNAVMSAKKLGVASVAFTRVNAKISELAGISVTVPSTNTQNIQECHILAYHVVVQLVESILYGGTI